MRLIYLSQNDNISTFLNDDTLNFDYDTLDYGPEASKILIFILLPLGIMSIFLFEYVYQKQQLSIFSMFLELEERFIKKIYRNCSQFVRKLEKVSDRSDDISIVPFKDDE
jgi:hypothetical protein